MEKNGSDEGIILCSSVSEVLGSTLGSADATELGFSDGSHDGFNDGKPVDISLGDSLG